MCIVPEAAALLIFIINIAAISLALVSGVFQFLQLAMLPSFPFPLYAHCSAA